MTEAEVIAICAALPPTLGSIATLVYVLKMKIENKASNDKIEAKVDNVQKEVDGKHSLMLEAIKTIATQAINPEPRVGRKTDP